MTAEILLQRFHQHVAATPASGPATVGDDTPTLVGFFQTFRPDGRAIESLFDDVNGGEQLGARIERLYETAGDDRRPQGGRDAYFVVRSPRSLDPELATTLGRDWLTGLRNLAARVGDDEVTAALDPIPAIRVLEGLPPKHPRSDDEKSELLRAVSARGPELIERLQSDPHAAALREAYYFIACDPMLRDYLMWPMFAETADIDDPFEPYFELWRHGVKYRIFTENQVDLYLPRPSG